MIFKLDPFAPNGISQYVESSNVVVGLGSGGGGSAGAYVSPDAPSSPSQGSLWLDSDDNTLYVFVNGSWVAISGGTPAGGSFDFVDGDEFEFIDGTYFDFIT